MATDTPENEPLNTDKANDDMIKVLSIPSVVVHEQKDDVSDENMAGAAEQSTTKPTTDSDIQKLDEKLRALKQEIAAASP